MYRILLPILSCLSVFFGMPQVFSQNIFNPSDPIIRYNQSRPLGHQERPDPARRGLQKWVSNPTNGVSTGPDAWDASSYKAYFLNHNGTQMAFRLKYPRTYSSNPTKKFPIMLFLHGAGEAGCNTNGGVYNNEKQLWLGGKLFSDMVNNNQFDGFLLYPQLVVNSTNCWAIWGSTPIANVAVLLNIIDSLGKYCRADIDRVAIDGLSGGGYGAWRMAALYPQRVAKILPSAAAGSTASRYNFVHIPIWFATGGKDPDPSPSQAAYAYNQMKDIGANIRYTQYPDLGHSMWYTHWREPDFAAELNDMHKANPLVFFQNDEFCPGQTVNPRLGITQGYYAYEWEKDGQTIAVRTQSTNSNVNWSIVSSFIGYEIVVKAFGTYRVRFKRTASSPWSDWSPKPAVIRAKAGSETPPITVNGLRSKVLPAPDGSTTVPLQLPAGFSNYQWVRVSDNAVVSTSATYNAPAGTYKARYQQQVGCEASYSPNFTVVNANGSPKPDPATNLTATPTSSTTTRLNWSQGANETGFEIYRKNSPGGAYQLIAIAAANTTSYDDPGLNPNATYFYIVRAINNTGAAANSNEASPDNGNIAPVISTIENIVVNAGSSVIRNFTVTDSPGDIVTVNIPSQPGFVTLQNTGGANYRLTVSPTANDIGSRDITVVATDNQGKSSSQTITILVSNNNTRSVLVNLGPWAYPAPAPWNNWSGVRYAGNVVNNLKDINNVSTGFSITTVNTWVTTTPIGHITGNNSGVVPDAVLRSGIADNGAAKEIRFGGLNPSKRYNLIFIGSQNEGLPATTEYANGSQRSVMDARYNTTRTANLNSLVPNSSGQITVTATRTGSTTFSYLNGIIIEEYDASITLLNPENLNAEPVDRTTVRLTWSDKTNNEAASNGYQLIRATNSEFSANVTTINLSGNTTTYTNTGLSPNTRYWYRVRARNGSNYSTYSNVVSTITPSSIIYVNFNTDVPNGPSPWNNMAASPMSLFTKTGLRNHANTVTGVGIKLEKEFNGEFNAGVSTGNNSGVVPDNVLKANYWLDNTQLSQFRITGLNNNQRYRFGFFGSSSSNGWFKGNYTATYSIGDRTVYLNSWQNSTKIVYIGDVVPSAGQVLIDFSTTAEADWGFNGGVIIHEYADNQGGTVLNSVLDDSGDHLSEQANRLAIYPNPFTDVINLGFNNSSPLNKVSSEIYDLSGKLIYRRDYANMPAGMNTLRILASEVNMARTGVYIVALKVNGEIVTRSKLVRTKR